MKHTVDITLRRTHEELVEFVSALVDERVLSGDYGPFTLRTRLTAGETLERILRLNPLIERVVWDAEPSKDPYLEVAE